MYFFDRSSLSGYKTVVYQKKNIVCSSIDFHDAALKPPKIDILLGSVVETVLVSHVQSSGLVRYNIFRDSKLIDAFLPPRGMKYLAFKAYNDGNDILGLLVPNGEDGAGD